ncbi:MAG TPA: mechanosensitive ion channel family protein [Thermoanaerobaculia bacterium]|nr:mechanosensitive ion channel family protein [Thermoanaerobaculia bacterium]
MFPYVVPISIAAGVLALVGLVRWIAVRRLAKAPTTTTAVDDFLLDLARRTKILLLLLPALFLGARALEMPRDVAELLRAGAGVSFIAQVALWVSGLIEFSLRRHRVNVFRIAAVVAVWIIATIVAIDNLGFNVTTLIAGLGIGGVAVALAMQNILSDLFASLSIVIDKPFVVGDSIAVDKDAGIVEHIGLKTTRLRATTGEELIFSNGELLKSRIRNFRRMQERRTTVRITASHATYADALARIPMLLRTAIEKQPDAQFSRAHLVKISDAGFEFEAVFGVAGTDYARFLDVQQSVLLDVARALGEAEVRLSEARGLC